METNGNISRAIFKAILADFAELAQLKVWTEEEIKKNAEIRTREVFGEND